MKTYRVEFTPDARQDMIDYAQYIASQEQNNRQALAWYEGMYSVVMGLATMPNRYPLARENNAFEQEVRQAGYQSHRAIYTVHEDLELVVIHRVWHTAKDDARPGDLSGLRSEDGD